MSWLVTEHSSGDDKNIGGKAKNLFALQKLGINVPKWAVVPQNVLLEQLHGSKAVDEVKIGLKELKVPENVMQELASYFGNDHQSKKYAVRSSAIDEDGKKYSFAGQYETFLHVPFSGIEQAIKQIWNTVVSDRVLKYRKENNIAITFGIGVIVQEMIDPDVSGVAFGLDPISGDTAVKVISAVYGLGEGLVSGELDADTFRLENETIEETITKKVHKIIENSTGSGVEQVDVPLDLQEKPTLNAQQLNEIATVLDKLNTHLNAPQDIEFALANDVLYLLQTRPVTAFGNSGKGEYIVWDNSNIIESYPGITTPLTFSFIIKMYEMVYRQFVGLMGVKEQEIEKHKDVFAHTLGLVRGRVYYNLLNWYKMLAMLPGYSINAGFMENMMGVKERFELKEDYRMSKSLARFRIIRMVFKMIVLQIRLPRERKRFLAHLNKVMTEYQQLDYAKMSVSEIVWHYERFERNLLLKWKAPLINDFFAMIWFGMLHKKTAKLFPEDPNIHNDLLCGSQDIISVEPIHRSMEIANLIVQNESSKTLFTDQTPEVIWNSLNEGNFPEVKAAIEAYIERFGNRCVGELKLETISFSQNPILFVKIIKSYVQQNITHFEQDKNIENELRSKAEQRVSKALSGRFFQRIWFNFILKMARDLVSNRENLRYERTRGFGMVRTMFSALGEKLFSEGKINDPRDIFYLELDEILALKDTPFTNKLTENIQQRKVEFARYKTQADPEERFYTYGNNFKDEYIYSKEKILPIEGNLKGIGCCPGRVQGKVHVVKDPNEIDSLNGDILVTSNTDPGWVTLFPTASAIIVERGSLLSHSAIVSREMGIPCIVSVTGLLRTLKTGDEIIMDGSTGEIQILNA